MERCFSYDKNLDDFSKPLAELYTHKYDNKSCNNTNNINLYGKNNNDYAENSEDQSYFNNIKNCMSNEQNLELYNDYKYNGKLSKSSFKRHLSYDDFRLNFSENNSENEKSVEKISHHRVNSFKKKDYYNTTSEVISEEDFSDFNNQELNENIQKLNMNQSEQENIKNANLNIDQNNISITNTDTEDSSNNKNKNDYISNFDPNIKDFNYTMRRNQTVQIIKEGIVQKKSPWFHYNTRKIVLDSTPRIEYIDPILNKVKVNLIKITNEKFYFFILKKIYRVLIHFYIREVYI